MTDTTKLRALLAKATNVGAWEVAPSGGKPTIHAGPGGNLFRGYVATWNEADLAVAAVNALPALCDAAEERDALAAKVAQLREALAMFVDAAKPRRQDGHHEMPLFSATEIGIARAALVRP